MMGFEWTNHVATELQSKNEQTDYLHVYDKGVCTRDKTSYKACGFKKNGQKGRAFGHN